MLLGTAIMQVRDSNETVPAVPTKFEEHPNGSALLEVQGKGQSTYLLGPQGLEEGSASGQPSLDGLAAVITWSKAGSLRSVLLQEGKRLQLTAPGGATLMIKTSAISTISLKLTSSNQYQLVHQTGIAAVTVELSLPWNSDSKEVNVWDSGHSCTKL